MWATDHCLTGKINTCIICHLTIFHKARARQSCIEKPVYSASFMLFPDWNGTEVLTNAVTNAVRSCLTTICCAAFYTVHRCFGKSDAFIISLVPMATKTDVSLWKILVLVLVQTAVKLTLCACVNSQSADEADANMISLCGFFSLWQTHEGGSSWLFMSMHMHYSIEQWPLMTAFWSFHEALELWRCIPLTL